MSIEIPNINFPRLIIELFAFAILVSLFSHYYDKCNKLQANLDTLNAAYDNVQMVNKSLQESIKQNEQIITEYVNKLATISKQTSTTKAVVKEVIKNDKISKAWSDNEIPSNIVNALNR